MDKPIKLPLKDSAVERNLAVDNDSFRDLRENGYIYVDKTDIVYRLTHSMYKNVFLMRPRRFGKTLLVDTLYWYFRGVKELFSGLKIEALESEWTQYPVIRLNMSNCVGDVELFTDNLSDEIADNALNLGLPDDASKHVGTRFNRLIVNAYRKSGLPVVVLIDEYDAPLQSAHGMPYEEELRRLYQYVFISLKSHGSMERFVFLTGCTRFKNLNLLSLLNHVQSVAFMPEYATLLGITEQEMKEYFAPEIAALAKEQKWRRGDVIPRLREMYDGYLFSLDKPGLPKVYNPCSLLHALSCKQLDCFWTDTGESRYFKNYSREILSQSDKMEGCTEQKDDLKNCDARTANATMVLYQTGYLTLLEKRGLDYALCVPNDEVRKTFYGSVLPVLKQEGDKRVDDLISALRTHLLAGELDDGLWAAKILTVLAPFDNTDIKALKSEWRAAFIVSTVCWSAGMHIRREEHVAGGIPDLIITALDWAYVIEFKLAKSGGVAAAWQQLTERNYVEGYLRPRYKAVFQVAIGVRDDGRALLDYQAQRFVQTKGQLTVTDLPPTERWRTPLPEERVAVKRQRRKKGEM